MVRISRRCRAIRGGEEFIFRSPGDVMKDFDLVSKGPDKQENTEDDVTNFSKDAKQGTTAN